MSVRLLKLCTVEQMNGHVLGQGSVGYVCMHTFFFTYPLSAEVPWRVDMDMLIVFGRPVSKQT